MHESSVFEKVVNRISYFWFGRRIFKLNCRKLNELLLNKSVLKLNFFSKRWIFLEFPLKNCHKAMN